MTHANKKILIIGGGPAGCSAAAYALKNGFTNVTILEGAKTLGGLHKDVEINGLHFDLGAFFFWKNHNIINLFPEIKEHLVYAESSKHLSLSNQFNVDRYPLSLQLYLLENGYFNTLWDVAKLLYFRALNSPDHSKNVNDLLRYYMGPFYVKSGLRNYIRRLYNMDPKDIDVEFASRRIGHVIDKFRFKNILNAFVKGKWSYFKRYEIVLDTWARPESGFESMYECVEQNLREQNCNIFFDQYVERIDLHKKSVQTASGKLIEYDYVISTQALAATGAMAGVPFDGTLKYKSLCSLFYEMPEQVIKDCFVLFNFTQKGKWKRATFHSNYYNRNKTTATNIRHYFVVESMPDESQIDNVQLAQELDLDFKATFQNTKLNDTFENAKLVGHHITRNAYPIFDTDFRRDKILAFKNRMVEHDIYMVGRQGEFEHVSSSDASKSAINAINTIIERERQISDKLIPIL
jgi:protoporphyrinogen oxidase